MEPIQIDPKWLAKWDRPVPRYTSYPTAPQFYPVTQELLIEKLTSFDLSSRPLSLYLHIPFCKTMCLFCGCSVVLNRNPDRQERYVTHLLSEIRQTARYFTKKRSVTQLHLGGGTPTSLTEEQFEKVVRALFDSFAIAPDAEISIEIDPRTVFADQGRKLKFLKELGFNRVSFGVQDLDPNVQEAVKRRQSEEMTVETYNRAKALGFVGINIDLIYGLPLQTVASFSKTADKILTLKPDRIAFYSYAKIPWLKPHQKAIREEDLPLSEEKIQIYIETRKRLVEGGYVPIGMDHFSLQSDPLVQAYFEKKLTRNFQGYSIGLADDMLGFGITAIGFLESTFFQNIKELEAYEESIQKKILPVFRGFVLSEEDQRRRFVIQKLMCHFELKKEEFTKEFGLDFNTHFASLVPALEELKKEALLENREDTIAPTPLGRLAIRIIASCFDAYLQKGQYSKAI